MMGNVGRTSCAVPGLHQGFTREKNAAKVWAVYEAVYPIAEVAG